MGETVRRFAIATSLVLVFGAIAPSQATSTQEADQLPGALDAKQWNDAQSLVTKASGVMARFKSEPQMVALMQQARGVFVIPEFGHTGAVSTGPWGAGVLMAHNNGQWSDPLYFTLGGGSLGPHVNANGGALILFIMNDRAMAKFESASNWSLSSAPGTNIVNYSAATPQDLSGHGADFVAWSASGGPNADTQASISDISFDTASNTEVYGTPDLRLILANRAPYINQAVGNLRRQMPSGLSATNTAPQTRSSPHA